MQIVIDIPEEVVKAIQNGKDYRYDIHTAIAQGTLLPQGHRGIVDLKDVQWAFDDAILEDAQRTGHVRATHNEIANILKTVSTIIEADAESEG